MDSDTLCVYSAGLTAVPGDDLVVLITGATSGGTVTDITTFVPSTAPLAAIRSDRIAFTDTSLQALNILGFNGTTVSIQSTTGLAGTADGANGSENLSIPFSPDDGVTVFTLYDNGTTLHRVNGTQVTTWPTTSALRGRPLAFSSSLLAAPGSADELVVFSEPSATPTITTHALRSPLNTDAKVLFAPLGAGGVVLPLLGTDGMPNTSDDEIEVFTDPLQGTSVRLGSLGGAQMLAPLGSGEIILLGPGADLQANSNDDTSTFINATATVAQNFATRSRWNQLVPPMTDATRAFAVGPGLGRIYNDGNEQLIVLQSKALGTFVDGALLPLALSGAPATGNEAFVPIGNSWGIIQSPGASQTYGDANDRILIVRY